MFPKGKQTRKQCFLIVIFSEASQRYGETMSESVGKHLTIFFGHVSRNPYNIQSKLYLKCNIAFLGKAGKEGIREFVIDTQILEI